MRDEKLAEEAVRGLKALGPGGQTGDSTRREY